MGKNPDQSSRRLAADTRAYMRAHPGIKYQQALAILKEAAPVEPDNELRVPLGTSPDGSEEVWTSFLHCNQGGTGSVQRIEGDARSTHQVLHRMVSGLTRRYTAARAQFVFIDLDGNSSLERRWVSPLHVAGTFRYVRTDEAQQEACVTLLRAELAWRHARLDAVGFDRYENIYEYTCAVPAQLPVPYLVVVVTGDDESPAAGLPDDLAVTLNRVGTLRALGGVVILATDSPSVDLGGIEVHIQSRIAVQPGSPTTGKVHLNTGEPPVDVHFT